MKNIYLLLFATVLWSCSSPSQKKSEATAADSAAASAENVKLGNVEVTDKSKYAASFIEELVAAKYEQPVKLTGEYLIAGADTISFPTDLTLNKPVVFVAANDSRHYELEITRINNTSVNFKFELTDNANKVLHSQTGEATLGALFFLGPESDEDHGEEAYDVIEYRNNTNDCFFSVRVEAGTAEKQRAKVSYGCNETSKPALLLAESPVLRAM